MRSRPAVLQLRVYCPAFEGSRSDGRPAPTAQPPTSNREEWTSPTSDRGSATTAHTRHGWNTICLGHA